MNNPAYDKWFKAEVARALKEANGPDIQWRTTEEVMATLDKKISTLRKKKRQAL